MSRCNFRLVIVKGLVEHQRGDVYFGSLGAYQTYWAQAEKAGWVRLVDGKEAVTEDGRGVYETCRLSTLPTTAYRRAYLWDWSSIPEPPE